MTATLQTANGKESRPGDRIVSSPDIRFGQPTVAGTAITCAIVYERFQAGDSVAELAVDYDLPASDIEAAIRFESAVNSRSE